MKIAYIQRYSKSKQSWWDSLFLRFSKRVEKVARKSAVLTLENLCFWLTKPMLLVGKSIGFATQEPTKM